MQVKELKYCTAERTSIDVITLYDKKGNFIGTICGNDPNGDWDKIMNNHDPIEEKWEDGAGNTLSIKEEQNKMKCQWCGELYDDTELSHEIHLGYLCSYCIQAIRSHGEKLCFRDN